MGFDFRVKTTAKVKQIMLAVPVPFTKKTARFTTQIYQSPETMATGISSRCMDGRHVLFFDYDNMELKQVYDEVRYLQNHFKLSTAYLFENDSKNSFHIIILDKFSVSEAWGVLKQSNVDWAYRESIKLTRGHEWVLRCSEKGNRKKPVLKDFILSAFDVHEISTAHKKFIQNYYDAPPFLYNKEDNINVLPVIDYSTGNRVD